MNRNWLAMAGIVALLGAAACGDDDGGGSGAGGSSGSTGGKRGIDVACEVFSTDELSDAMGAAMLPGTSEEPSDCEWTADGDAATSVSLEIDRGGASGYDLLLAMHKGFFESATFTDLEGVGDKAYLMVVEMELAGDVAVTATAVATQGDDLVMVGTTRTYASGAEIPLADTTRELLVTALERI